VLRHLELATLIDLPQLALTFSGDGEKLLRHLDRGLLGWRLEDREASDQLLGLGERAVDDADRTIDPTYEADCSDQMTPDISRRIRSLSAVIRIDSLFQLQCDRPEWQV
jgi:hypothetical protein